MVAVALIDHEGYVLVQQRPAGSSMAGLWEFPGGKIETHETPEQALLRELLEELGITLLESVPLSFVSAPLDGRQLLMLLYTCRCWDGEPLPLYASAIRWVLPRDLGELDMPPADRPLVAALMTLA